MSRTAILQQLTWRACKKTLLTTCLLFLLFFAGPNTVIHDKAVIANAAILASATFGCGNMSLFRGERECRQITFWEKSVVVRGVMPAGFETGHGSNDSRTGSVGSTLLGRSGWKHARQMTAGPVGSGLRSCEKTARRVWMLRGGCFTQITVEACEDGEYLDAMRKANIKGGALVGSRR
jgi:hypothetical protein